MKKGKRPKSQGAKEQGFDLANGVEEKSAPSSPFAGWTATLFRRLAIVLAGIVLTQVILFGPSLAGRKILLPLDILAGENVYIPAKAGDKIVAHNLYSSDLVFEFEPQRQFAVSEFRSGRLPMWAPYQYAGVPVVWPKFSPFLLLECCTDSPIILAWVQLMGSLVAGFGAYAFCRKSILVGFWPAAFVAWCYPLTGFFVLWQGYTTCFSAWWLPWLLLAVDATVRTGGPARTIGLCVATCLVLVSGHIDIAGQVLLISGLYGAWRLVEVRGSVWWQRKTLQAGAMLAMGWLAGFLLAAPHLLPLMEYAQTGSRVASRSMGNEERPPKGLSELPQVVLPDMYGANLTGSFRTIGPQAESSAAAYAGLLAALFFAPMAWTSKRHRPSNLFWSLIGFFALAWCLNVPGIVTFLRLPILNLMSHNRLVFATAFAFLILAAVGMESLWQGNIERRWLWLAMFLPGIVAIGCIYRVINSPAEIASLTELVKQGKSILWIHNQDDVQVVQKSFATTDTIAAGICVIGILGGLVCWLRPAWRMVAVPALGVVMVGDLLWFAHGRSTQSDPKLYYPRIPALEQIARSIPGRIIGYGCLPATLSATHGLPDIRGYDSIDPERMVDLLLAVADPAAPRITYAKTQMLVPRSELYAPDDLTVPPIIDLLGVRYFVFRGGLTPGVKPAFQSDDYWVLVNKGALPRAFVPSRVEVINDSRERLMKLASPEFKPREVAYVESPVNLSTECRGQAVIKREIPTEVIIETEMQSAGLVVLTDRWDAGWKALLNGQPAPILR